MKTSRRLPVALFATAAISLLSTLNPAKSAVNFGQTEVDQGKLIAIAAPYGTNNYQLLILEQISNKRQCWSESGSNPVVVDPLLLQFDFTGICGRSTDSNGYSIRMAGTDLGLKYNFNIVKRDNDLVLVGTNFSDRKAPIIEIGRTNGISDGFLKFNLAPEWRFTKRTLDGKTLGHVYLTSTQAPPPGTGIDVPPTGNYTFGDIAADVYAPEIEQAVQLGFVAGFKEDNTFRPQVALTREQLVSMVLEALGKLPGASLNIPAQASSRPYPDVDAKRWSAAKIQWARDNKIVSGYTDGTFQPTKPVTRAELMAVQRRAAEYALSLQGSGAKISPKNTAKTFSDTANHWAAPLISEMSAYCNVASPVNETGTRFDPNSSARRNYAAAATLRMLNCVQEKQSATGTP